MAAGGVAGRIFQRVVTYRVCGDSLCRAPLGGRRICQSCGGRAMANDHDEAPRQIQARLLAWYDTHRRSMPWRESPSPWGIWVSEIMLQQTRVDSVIDYYHRFMARYPTPAALAASSLDELLGFWAGLGYYARARNLYRAAQMVVEEHGGSARRPRGFSSTEGRRGIYLWCCSIHRVRTPFTRRRWQRHPSHCSVG